MLGWKFVVACWSALIPRLLWHLSVSFFFTFFHSLFLPCHSCPVLSASIYSPLSSLLHSPLSLDTCHYPVLNRPFSLQNVSARLTVTACVCMCVIKETRVCVRLHWSVCARVYLCVSGCVSHPVTWKSCVSQWRLRSNFLTQDLQASDFSSVSLSLSLLLWRHVRLAWLNMSLAYSVSLLLSLSLFPSNSKLCDSRKLLKDCIRYISTSLVELKSSL